MNLMTLLLALLLLAALVACAYRLSAWVRTAASQRIKKWVTVALLFIVVTGLFLRLQFWAASALSAFVAVCVGADFLLHHRRESDIAG